MHEQRVPCALGGLTHMRGGPDMCVSSESLSVLEHTDEFD